MNIEKERGEIAGNSDILIVGTGEVGDKAQQLIDKTPALRALGFHTPHRTILAEGFFDDFFQKNGLGTCLRNVVINQTTESAVKKACFPSGELETLHSIGRIYSDNPLVVRSSAQGDARGTGTYKSVFIENKFEHFLNGIQQVLGSYFSSNAVAFRRDADTGEGFAVIVEPIIGNDFGGIIAPVISGYGYTSTSQGEGYLTIAPGLGCAVESKYGERVTKSRFDQRGVTLGDYIYSTKHDMFSDPLVYMRQSSLLRTELKRDNSHGFNIQAFQFSNRWQNIAEVIDTTIDYPDNIKRVLDNLNLNPIFSAMNRMEQLFKRPQYFEWAMTVSRNQSAFWIIQIADVDKKIDFMDFENVVGKVMFTGSNVVGTGVKEATKIVCCWSPEDIKSLGRFNGSNKDYVLIFSNLLISSIRRGNTLNYQDFCNASVILGCENSLFTEDPIAHFKGQLDVTGKLFGVVDYDAETPADWDQFNSGSQVEEKLRVYHGKIKVVSSERQNKLVIYDQEKK